MHALKKTKPRFHVGDWVSFLHVVTPLWGQVVEDRGQLGVKGRRLYRVRVEGNDYEAREFTRQEDELQFAVPEKAALMEYLQSGGLLALLRGYMDSTQPQPRAWLTFTRKGKLTPTFDRDRGVLGGIPLPFFAIYPTEQVFAPKKKEVLEFLTGFGLTKKEAAEVIEAVGTAP